MIFPVTAPEIPLAQFVLQQAAERGTKPALIDGANGRTLSYAQLWAQVRHVAKSLAQRGYRKGDVFALASPNLPEYAVALHAILTMGGVVLPLDPHGTAAELAQQLQAANARCLLTTAAGLRRALAAAEPAPLRDIFTFDSAPRARHFAELCESILQENEAPTDALIDARRDAALLPPGAARRSHYGLALDVLEVAAMEADDPVSARDVMFCGAAFQHPHGLLLLNYALYHGATLVTLPRVEPAMLLHTLQKYRVTRAALTPVQLEWLATYAPAKPHDLATLQVLYSETAPGDALAQQCAARFQCRVKQVYGAGE